MDFILLIASFPPIAATYLLDNLVGRRRTRTGGVLGAVCALNELHCHAATIKSRK